MMELSRVEYCVSQKYSSRFGSEQRTKDDCSRRPYSSTGIPSVAPTESGSDLPVSVTRIFFGEGTLPRTPKGTPSDNTFTHPFVFDTFFCLTKRRRKYGVVSFV